MIQSTQHTIDTPWVEDQLTTRYTCRSCPRCVEDVPEGLRVLARGDVHAIDQGGVPH
jgi:hypothetical protein